MTLSPSTTPGAVSKDCRRFPVTSVSYDDVLAYAAWLDRTGELPGVRLCDEYEWERAAPGAEARLYPGWPWSPLDARQQAHGPGQVCSVATTSSSVGVAPMG